MSPTPVIILGAQGRMGQNILSLLSNNNNFILVAKLSRQDNLAEVLAGLDHKKAVLIDFSAKDCLHENLQAAQKFKLPFLLCTTGHDEDLGQTLKKAAHSIAVLYAPNTSLMANLLIYLTKISAQVLPKSTQTHILDIHHQHKKDAPSGTALALKKAINSSTTQISSIRAGQVTGEHSVFMFSEDDRLELSHKVTHRRVFAEGALIAAQFIFNQNPGLYEMNDVLNLKLTIH